MRCRLRGGLAIAMVMAGVASMSAQAAEPVRFDRFRAYLIFEDTGNLSKNVAGRTDQILANTEEGSSVQILIDIVAAGGENQVYEDGPLLLTWATSPYDPHGPFLVDKGWAISYVGLTGEVTRTIVVDHDCEPFTLHARVDRGDAIGEEFSKEFNIWCGD